VIGWYVRLAFARWLVRTAGRVLRWGLLAAVLAAAAPLSVVAGIGLLGAWLRGWPPARLRRAGWWCLPMTAAYLTARALAARTWQGFAAAIGHDWQHAYRLAVSGRVVTAFALCAPLAIPAGLVIASGLWAWRIYTMDTGLAGRTATAPVVFDERQWRRASRAARGRVTAPGAFPLASRDGKVVMGATIRAVGHRWRPALSLDYATMGRHQVIVGSSGSGKTNLMMRTWAGWYTAALHAHHRHGEPRPLLVVMDCKGGPDSRAKAQRTRALLHAAGARRVAIWPDEATISLWNLPADDLAVALFQLIESGTDGWADSGRSSGWRVRVRLLPDYGQPLRSGHGQNPIMAGSKTKGATGAATVAADRAATPVPSPRAPAALMLSAAAPMLSAAAGLPSAGWVVFDEWVLIHGRPASRTAE
jgi:hypothetical protein